MDLRLLKISAAKTNGGHVTYSAILLLIQPIPFESGRAEALPLLFVHYPSLESEVCPVDGAVVQLNYQLATGTGPGWIGLPDVDVAISCRIVTEAAAARRYGLRQITRRIARVARHRSRRW